MKDLYVLVRQNKWRKEDFCICYADSNESFHYSDLRKAIVGKRTIEALYGDDEIYTIYKLVSVEDTGE